MKMVKPRQLTVPVILTFQKKYSPTRRRIDPKEIGFQKDSATPHTTRQVTDWLHQTFNGNFSLLKPQMFGPPHSPDLSPLDFFLWGHLKNLVYKPQLDSETELRISIRTEIRKISNETCAAVALNFLSLTWRPHWWIRRTTSFGARSLGFLCFVINRFILWKKTMHICEICWVKMYIIYIY